MIFILRARARKRAAPAIRRSTSYKSRIYRLAYTVIIIDRTRSGIDDTTQRDLIKEKPGETIRNEYDNRSRWYRSYHIGKRENAQLEREREKEKKRLSVRARALCVRSEQNNTTCTYSHKQYAHHAPLSSSSEKQRRVIDTRRRRPATAIMLNSEYTYLSFSRGTE